MKRFVFILRILCSLAIFAITAEMCARLDDCITYGAPPWSSYNNGRLFEQDRIGQRGRPGARYKKWQLNSLGYRSPELRAGTVRIICLGASETFGLYERDGQEYPRQLERDLNARAGGDTFQVVNVAYPGETVATAILRVPEIVETIHPRFAILYPSPASYIWLPWIRPRAAGAEVPSEEPNKFEFRVADRVRNALKSGLPESLQTWLRQREINAAAAEYPLMGRVPDENVLRYRADLARLIEALRSRDVEPVLVTHADPFSEHPTHSEYQLLTAWRKFYPMLTEDGFVDMERRMNEAMRSVAAGENVPMIDAAREIPPSRDNFADFCHFTTRGATLMASRLADGFSKQNHSELPPISAEAQGYSNVLPGAHRIP